MLVLLASSLAFADDVTNNTSVDLNETIGLNDTVNNTITETSNVTTSELDEDLEIMTSHSGTIIRFLQLERQLDVKIERGNLIINRLEELGNYSVSDLQTIIDQLVIIKEEVSVYTSNNFTDLTQASIDYVDLKNESVNLISEFRTLIRSMVDESLLGELNNLVSSVNETSFQGLGLRIQEMKREYNSNQVRNTLQNMGYTDEELVGQVLNGTLNQGQIMQRLRSVYENLTSDARREAAVNIRQSLSQGNIAVQSINDAVMNNSEQRQLNRLQERADKLADRLNNSLNNVERLQERIQERISNISSQRSENSASSGSNSNGRGNNNE